MKIFLLKQITQLCRCKTNGKENNEIFHFGFYFSFSFFLKNTLILIKWIIFLGDSIDLYTIVLMQLK